MKNLFKARIAQILGIVALVVIMGLSMAACEEELEIGNVTITGIPSTYNGKFAMMLVDRGGTTQAYGIMETISGTSITFGLLDWDTDASTTISEGNYSVSIVIAENAAAAASGNFLYAGVLSKALSGETVSIAFSEFVSSEPQMSATVTGIPAEHNGKYARVYVYNVGSERPDGGFYYGTAAGSSNQIQITNGTVTTPLFVHETLITTNPLNSLTPGNYHATLFMYESNTTNSAFYQSNRLEITVTTAINIPIAFSELTAMD